MRMIRAADNAIGSLYPGYFAMVMATGIVSNAFYALGERTCPGRC